MVRTRVQMKSWAGKALETVNCCAFLKRTLIGANFLFFLFLCNVLH
jgi:hypothetical protein